MHLITSKIVENISLVENDDFLIIGDYLLIYYLDWFIRLLLFKIELPSNAIFMLSFTEVHQYLA